LASARNSSIVFQDESALTVIAAGSAFSRAIMRKSSAVNWALLIKGRMTSSTVTKPIL
jgi:hypothetical protein